MGGEISSQLAVRALWRGSMNYQSGWELSTVSHSGAWVCGLYSFDGLSERINCISGSSEAASKAEKGENDQKI
jgi:hypothetical protein